ncbi:MAG: hypothetical protein GPJ54_05795 [Candidatus Heimdallarchaeota archaeon]|nr:hypothetical protein [Candidatus Heimdallarchaeota archaeon]
MKSNLVNELNKYCQSILQNNGELLTIAYAPDTSTCSYVFLIPDDKIKYKVLNVECKNEKIQSIKQYFNVAEIYEYELHIQYGFIIESGIVEEAFKLVIPKNSLDLNIHQKSSQIYFVEVGLGYNYRNIENNLILSTPIQILADISKLFNTCTSAHQIAFAAVIEQLSNTRVNTETKFARMLLSEFERITNHLLWLGMLFMGMGRRELSLEVLHLQKNAEEIKNNLIGSGQSIVFNNPAYNLSQELIENTEVEITALNIKLQSVSKNLDYVDCLRLLNKIGPFSYAESIKYGVVGPIARAAGVKDDLRIQQPYLIYDKMSLPVVVGEDGTLQEIVKIRLKEVECSISIIIQILKKCDPWEGDQREFSQVLNSNATAIVNIEAPNGRLTYFIQTNDNGQISQLRISIPSLTNFIPTIKRMLKADIRWLPTISRLFDTGIDPLDNLTVVEIETGKSKAIASHEIRHSSRISILSIDE